MNRFAQSLYGRLALVLLLALGASYATMYLVFQSHLEDTREGHFARVVAVQAHLVEELLRLRPSADLSGFNDVVVATALPNAGTDAGDTDPHLKQLRERLTVELGREAKLIPSTNPIPGFWLDLRASADQPRWLFVSTRTPHVHRGDPLLTALMVGFAVFFAGGMLLLWQVQRPLKRLGKALEAVGQSPQLTKLPVTGVGETRVLGERYNDMVERLQRYEEDRVTMLAGVAHDLRSPLTRLRLLMELEEGSRTAEMRVNLDDIERITEQFLVYARGMEDEPIEERDLAIFVDEVAAPYAAQQVTTGGEQSGTSVAIRAGSLRRALVNLIENAIEYGQVPIVVRCAKTSAGLTIAVEDAGTGIEDSQIARAMRPFSRLDASRGGKGHCGLGLVIAAKVAEAHGGSLQLRNGERGGFVAAIHLPLKA